MADNSGTGSSRRVWEALNLTAHASALTGPVKRDSMPLIPNAASLVATEKPKTPAPKTGQNIDQALLRKEAQLASDFSQILTPNEGKASLYSNFFQRLRSRFQRQRDVSLGGKRTGLLREDQRETAETEGEDESVDTDSEETPEKEVGKKGQVRLAEQETDPAEFPPELRWILEEVARLSKSVAEQHNFLCCAREMAKAGTETYGAQEAAAKQRLQDLQKQLAEASGPQKERLRATCARTEGSLVAIRADQERTQGLLNLINSVLSALEKKSGDRIRDGYNIIPKARSVIASSGLGGVLSAPDLASNYRNEVLCMVNPGQLFENFMVRYKTMGFPAYVRVILLLLGDDIKSANPSRGIGQLQAIRDGLFFAEISYQIYLSVGAANQKLQRIRILAEKENNSYEPCLLNVSFQHNRLEIAIARGKGQPCFCRDIRLADDSDHFSELTEIIDSFCVDRIVMANCEEGEARSLRLSVQRRYGLPIQRSIPHHWEGGIRRDISLEELFPEMSEETAPSPEGGATVPQGTASKQERVVTVDEVVRSLQNFSKGPQKISAP
ncbi:MAG: hypothetical protein LBB14_01160 [Puniceicoccales bacterium]|jgi:hypothetical protein|nr:hypothetical protein [Puniceicoccales bacterium]